MSDTLTTPRQDIYKSLLPTQRSAEWLSYIARAFFIEVTGEDARNIKDSHHFCFSQEFREAVKQWRQNLIDANAASEDRQSGNISTVESLLLNKGKGKPDITKLLNVAALQSTDNTPQIIGYRPPNLQIIKSSVNGKPNEIHADFIANSWNQFVIDQCHFSNCKFDFTYVDSSIFDGVSFTDCQAYRTRFRDCTFKNLKLAGLNLSQAELFGITTFENVDFHDVDPAQIRNLIPRHGYKITLKNCTNISDDVRRELLKKYAEIDTEPSQPATVTQHPNLLLTHEKREETKEKIEAAGKPHNVVTIWDAREQRLNKRDQSPSPGS